MKVFLSYVNKADTTVQFSPYPEFDKLVEVVAWVDQHHSDWTSYDVIVVRSKEDAR